MSVAEFYFRVKKYNFTPAISSRVEFGRAVAPDVISRNLTGVEVLEYGASSEANWLAVIMWAETLTTTNVAQQMPTRELGRSN